MKKKLLGIGIFSILAGLSLSSCGFINGNQPGTTNNSGSIGAPTDSNQTGSSTESSQTETDDWIPQIEYENSLSKGNSVDSINVEVVDHNTNNYKTVTISKTDSYVEMMNKLGVNIFYSHRAEDGYNPFCEKALVVDSREQTNYPTNKVVKNSAGMLEELSEITSGNIKKYKAKASNATMYNYNNNESFCIGNEVFYNKDEYHLASGDLEFEGATDYLNQGTYYNYQGSISEGGSIKFASNREGLSALKFNSSATDEDINLFNNYGSLYFEKEFGANDPTKENRSVYKAENYNVNFDVKSLSQCRYLQTAGASGDAGVCNVAYMYSELYGSPSNEVKKYCELSFELTDKYLVIKNKINTSEIVLDEIENGVFSDENEKNAALEMCKGSYTYKEVWVDYKNILKNNDSNNPYVSMGYAYFKYDIVSNQESSITWKAGDESAYNLDDGKLSELGLIGKTSKRTTIDERHIETYLVEISNDVINSKKTSFINQCRSDNFLEKYNFQKVIN